MCEELYRWVTCEVQKLRRMLPRKNAKKSSRKEKFFGVVAVLFVVVVMIMRIIRIMRVSRGTL